MCCAWAAEVQACTARRVLHTWLSAWVRLRHDQQGLALHSHAEKLVLSHLAILDVHVFTASTSLPQKPSGNRGYQVPSTTAFHILHLNQCMCTCLPQKHLRNLWKLPARHDFQDL